MIAIRERNPLIDDGFIFSAWMTSTLDKAGQLTDADARRERHEEVRLALRHGRTLVACPVDDDDTIVGFATAIGGHLLYAYVKLAFRGLGVATQLAEALGCAWPPQPATAEEAH